MAKSPFEEFDESSKKERLRREKEAEEIIANFPKMVKSFIIRLGIVLFFVAAIILAYLSSKELLELLEQRELFSVEKYYNLYLLIMTVVLARWISQSIKEVSKAIVDVVDKLRKQAKSAGNCVSVVPVALGDCY